MTPESALDLDSGLGARTLVAHLDLTSLDATDTPDDIAHLGARAATPSPGIPPVAAICVWPALVGHARAAVAGTPVRVASVGAGFPAGQLPPAVRTADVAAALDAGAHEIDMVIPRGSFRAGDDADVRRAVSDVWTRCRDRAEPAVVKVIVETCELGGPEGIRRACALVLDAAAPEVDGALFLKTSTGKGSRGATDDGVRLLAEAARDYRHRHGACIGIKPAGGVRTPADARRYAGIVRDVLGAAALTPALFRIGASSLLDALVREIDPARAEG